MRTLQKHFGTHSVNRSHLNSPLSVISSEGATTRVDKSVENHGATLFSAASLRRAGSNAAVKPFDPEDLNNEYDINLVLYGTRNNSIHLWFWWCPYEGFESSRHVKSWMYLCTRKPSSWSGLDLNVGSPSLPPSTSGLVRTIPFNLDACDIFENWLDLSAYGDCYVVIETQVERSWEWTDVGHETRPDGSTVTTTTGMTTTQTLRRVVESTNRLSAMTDIKASAPKVTIDSTGLSASVTSTMRGKPILEFHDVNAGYPPEVSALSSEVADEVLMNFYLASMIRMEPFGNYSAYYHAMDDDGYGNRKHLIRWTPGRYGVSVADTVGDGNGSLISSCIDEFISEINAAISYSGVSFYRDDSLGETAPVVVVYGTMKSLWGETPSKSYLHGGQWGIWSWIDPGKWLGGVDHARVEIAKEAMYYTSLRHVCFEEFYQMLGCGWDQWEYPRNTCTTDAGGIYMPDYLTDKDRCMLQLQYSDRITNGVDVTAVALAHNIPKGIIVSESDVYSGAVKTFSLSQLEPGHTYDIRAWIVDSSGKMSYTSEWVRVTIPGGLKKWQWTTVGPKNSIYAMSAREWNDGFVPCVNAVRKFKGLSEYGAFSQAPAVKGQNMSIRTFNHAVYAIVAMYPSWQQSSLLSKHILKAGDTISINQFNGLRDLLNALIPN